MPSKHMGRITEDIHRELTDIFRSIKDPRVSPMTTVIRVDVSGDLSYAKVYVSTMGDEAEGKATVKGLTSAAGYIRRELGHRLSLRKTPELKFIHDQTTAHGAHIAQILNGLDLPAEDEEKDGAQ